MTALLNDLEGIMHEFNIEEDKLIVPLPSIKKPMLLHWGSESGYERFSGNSYFIGCCDVYENNLIYKYIVMKVEYISDELYRQVDGNAGRCWIVTINDNKHEVIIKYYIRNWIDIVEYFKEKGLEFIEESNK
jgi:hypothetical protein